MVSLRVMGFAFFSCACKLACNMTVFAKLFCASLKEAYYLLNVSKRLIFGNSHILNPADALQLLSQAFTPQNGYGDTYLRPGLRESRTSQKWAAVANPEPTGSACQCGSNPIPRVSNMQACKQHLKYLNCTNLGYLARHRIV